MTPTPNKVKAEVAPKKTTAKAAAVKTKKVSSVAETKAPKPVQRTLSVEERGRRRERQGVVVSDKMQKTIVVEITRLVPHPLYSRVVKRKNKVAAHDEKGEAKLGDRVRIIETHPISKTKRWKLAEVLK